MTLIRINYIFWVISLLQLYLMKTADATISISIEEISDEDVPDFIGLAANSGYAAKSYDIVTEDGYILKVFHIPGNKSRPVFLMHGLLDSSDGFILREDTSLAIALANDGCDVWAGNYRGNKYSRRHLTLDPDVDKGFWDYSFHEIAAYDITAMIDFILDKTNQKQLTAIGHSEGTTFFYTLGAIKPEYNEKIKVMISLAPICYVENVKGALAPFVPITREWNALLESLGLEELLSNNSSMSEFSDILCGDYALGYVACNYFTLPAIAGYDPEQMEPDFLAKAIKYYPAGTSRKNVVHLFQLSLFNRFAQYDYGPIGNQNVYNSILPPAYDLSKVTMKVALIVAKNDYISVIKDVRRLQNELPNVVEYYELEPDLFNHSDFILGRDTYKVLYSHVVELVQKYDEI